MQPLCLSQQQQGPHQASTASLRRCLYAVMHQAVVYNAVRCNVPKCGTANCNSQYSVLLPVKHSLGHNTVLLVLIRASSRGHLRVMSSWRWLVMPLWHIYLSGGQRATQRHTGRGTEHAQFRVAVVVCTVQGCRGVGGQQARTCTRSSCFDLVAGAGAAWRPQPRQPVRVGTGDMDAVTRGDEEGRGGWAARGHVGVLRRGCPRAGRGDAPLNGLLALRRAAARPAAGQPPWPRPLP